MSTTTHTRSIETIIIGAGQAGLATAYHLTRQGHRCVVLDAHHRVGDTWRHQYDSLTLFTFNRYNALPGMTFPGKAWEFATKDELADYLEAYAARFDLPVRLDSRVTGVTRHRDRFLVATAGDLMECDSLVIATGPFGAVPSVPACATDLDESILQLHSSEYRRPDQLRRGAVLVVGGGHSGCDIALDVATSHPTTLVGRDPGQIPVSWKSPMLRAVLPVVMFAHKHLRTRSTPLGRRQRPYVLAHGGEMLRVKRTDLTAAGVERIPKRVVGARDGLPLLADERTMTVSNVIWATGYRHDFSWLSLPILDESDWPREYRGVADDVDGLFFCGLAYQYAFSSMNVDGAGRDAAYIVRRIVSRRPSHRRDTVGAA